MLKKFFKTSFFTTTIVNVYSFTCLYNIADGNRAAIAAQGGIDAVVAAMKTLASNAGVQEQAAGTVLVRGGFQRDAFLYLVRRVADDLVRSARL